MTNRLSHQSPSDRANGKPALNLPAVMLATALMASSACSFQPQGMAEQQQALLQAGVIWQQKLEQRASAPLPAPCNTDDLVERALSFNGEAEAAWQQWRAALERVEQASAWPNSKLAIGSSFNFPSNGASTADRIGLVAAFDSMENLAFPSKTKKAGEIALADARAARDRFVAVQLMLRRRVMEQWAAYGLAAADHQTALALRELDRLENELAANDVAVGARASRSLETQFDLAHSDDAVAQAQAKLDWQRAQLSGLLALPATEVPAAPDLQPYTRDPIEEATLIRALDERNPQLRALAEDLQSKDRSVELAELQWTPDFNPLAMLTGGIAQSVGVGIMLPTTVQEIRASIREAQARRDEARSVLAQSKHDRTAELLAQLVLWHDANRRHALFSDTIVPVAEALAANVNLSWTVGATDLSARLDAERVVLQSEFVATQAVAESEIAWAAIEELSGIDPKTFETKELATITQSGSKNSQFSPSNNEAPHQEERS